MKAFARLPLTSCVLAACALLLIIFAARPLVAQALGSSDPVQNGSVGLEGRVSAPPPTQAATITTPRNGQTFTSSPIQVAGLCKSGLLVKLFANSVFVGSEMCNEGAYDLEVSLFGGRNDLVARVYDSLDQAGPDSNVVTVVFNDANYAQFGTQLTLTSSYARRGTNPGNELSWPMVLSGGTGPYALSADWGDSTGQDLRSLGFAGRLTLEHTYQQAGVYNVTIKTTDSNDRSAYLQVVAIVNGTPTSGASTDRTGTTGSVAANKGGMPWYAFLPVPPLLLAAFWLGSRNELYTIHRRLERARSASQE